MQRAYYNNEASRWNIDNRNPVIGNWDAHQQYDDYDDLFGELNTSELTALEFGCGPGRNLIRFHSKFLRVDGVDISSVALEKAKIHLAHENIPDSNITLCETNGVDLQNFPSDWYDVVFSVISLQHICVHEIRYNLFSEFYRVLQSGGIFTAQMGFGERVGGHDYYENYYDADGTNGWHDVMVSDPTQLQKDLYKIGFEDFKYHLTEPRGGDVHSQWIYFNCRKP